MSQLEIIYQDKYLAIINKPSGLLVHRSPIDRHETRFALQMLRDQIGQHVYPLHRLDKPTSGALVFALSSEIASKLSESFQQHKIDKTYLAVVRGYAPLQLTIDYPLKPQFDKMIHKQDSRIVEQEATTRIKRLASVEVPHFVDRYPQSRYSLVEVKPVTGRKHQIRRHLKHIAHPIIGDAKHGKGTHNRFFQQQYNCHRLLLACTSLSFNHPVKGDVISVTAGLDEQFLNVLNEFGWERLPH